MLGGFNNVEGVDLEERGKNPASSPSTSSASRPTTSWSWSRRRPARGGPRLDPAFIARARARHATRPPPIRRPRRMRCSPPARPRPGADPRPGRRDTAAAAAAERQALWLHGPRGVAGVRRLPRRPGPDRHATVGRGPAHGRVAAGAVGGRAVCGWLRLAPKLDRQVACLSAGEGAGGSVTRPVPLPYVSCEPGSVGRFLADRPRYTWAKRIERPK